MTTQILNIAGYKFVTLNHLELLQQQFKEKCMELNLKGTILLSHEGTNQFLAGTLDSIRNYQAFLQGYLELSDLSFKESWSEHQPFKRLFIKVKPEIISLGMDEIKPAEYTVPTISPEQLKQWFDENKKFTLLDTRNRFEFERGSFNHAVDLELSEFRSFPKALEKLPQHLKDEPIVIFCTGGIRCEKAGPAMNQQGFKEVYQLEGGILNYFEHCGAEHYHGDCFVFDERIALDGNLVEVKES